MRVTPLIRYCIADYCGKPFDPTIPETRENNTLRPFWNRYCPEHRVTGKIYEPIIAVEAPKQKDKKESEEN